MRRDYATCSTQQTCAGVVMRGAAWGGRGACGRVVLEEVGELQVELADP